MGFSARAVISIPAVSGVPRDGVKMDFSFSSSTTGESLAAKAPEILTALDSWLTGGAAGARIDELLSPSLSRVPLDVTYAVYDVGAHLDGSPGIGSPVATLQGGLHASASNASVVEEVAIVLSMRADLGATIERDPALTSIPTSEAAVDSGAPATHLGHARFKSRRRGRVYIGPLCSNAVGQDTPSNRTRVDVATRNLILARRSALVSPLTSFWVLSVWSRRDAAMRPVVQMRIDDAFDTQRKRGPRAVATSVIAFP
jgi:hypothetical protein